MEKICYQPHCYETQTWMFSHVSNSLFVQTSWYPHMWHSCCCWATPSLREKSPNCIWDKKWCLDTSIIPYLPVAPGEKLYEHHISAMQHSLAIKITWEKSSYLRLLDRYLISNLFKAKKNTYKGSKYSISRTSPISAPAPKSFKASENNWKNH